MRTLLPLSLITSLFVSLPVLADWQLVSPSEVTLVSTKNHDVAEVFRFQRLEGKINQQGQAQVALDLTSIDSAIEIRDQRMRDILFETKLFPKATLTANLDLTALTATQTYILDAVLDLHGQQQDIKVPVLIVKASNDNIVVTSLQPVLVHGSQFQLSKGIMQLQEIAKLERISDTVPVSFTLTFTPTK